MRFSAYWIVILLGIVQTSDTYNDGQIKRIIRTENEEMLLDDDQVQELIRKNIKFMDLTFSEPISLFAAPKRITPPQMNSWARQKEVYELIEKINPVDMMRNMHGLISFHTRYYKSPFGRDAAQWIYDIVRQLAKGSPYKVTIKKLHHRHWPQFSVSCIIENSNSNYRVKPRERILLSSHMDSIASFAPMIMPAPGADDDGSGVVTQLEVLRLLCQSHELRLSRPIEFLFFSAEEGGLLGSQSIVRHYIRQEISTSLLHIDMDGYRKPGTRAGIGLIMDNTDPELNRFLRRLITMYTSLPIKETKCGYACSDHYSWSEAGYPAAALFEGYFEEMSTFIHSNEDRPPTIDYDHMAEFVKVALAFALHMTEPDF